MDWKEPFLPGVSSTYDEEMQLEALKKHIAFLKKDLQQHNDLQNPMMNLIELVCLAQACQLKWMFQYQPKSPNMLKAQINWERKLEYILKKTIKYESYIDSLTRAMFLCLKKVGEKDLSSTHPDLLIPAENISHEALECVLDRATSTDENYALKGKCKGPETRIHEEIQSSIPVSMILA